MEQLEIISSSRSPFVTLLYRGEKRKIKCFEYEKMNEFKRHRIVHEFQKEVDEKLDGKLARLEKLAKASKIGRCRTRVKR